MSDAAEPKRYDCPVCNGSGVTATVGRPLIPTVGRSGFYVDTAECAGCNGQKKLIREGYMRAVLLYGRVETDPIQKLTARAVADAVLEMVELKCKN